MSWQLEIINPRGLVKQRKLLEENRFRFLNHSSEHLPLRSTVYDSWLRCRQSGIDPGRHKTEDPLNSADIETMLGYSKLYNCSIATLNELLIQAEKTKYLITLCDSHGRITYLGGNRQVKKQAEKMNFVLGSCWSEEAIGTNAIGTSLKTGHPVQIFAAEHFCEGIHDWVCSSAPVYDPLTKEILGVIDITGSWKEAQTHTLGLVLMTSRVIEHKLYEQSAMVRTQLLERYASVVLRYPQDGVIILDAAFKPIEANLRARKFIREVTGKDLEILWGEQEFTGNLVRNDLKLLKGDYEIFIKPLGIPGLIQEIQQRNRRIGFILILSPAKQFSPSPPQHNTTQITGLMSTPWGKVIGKSSKVLSAMTQCNIVAKTNVPVLLLGESGSGKELFAKAIHEISERRKGPFVALNCGAIPNELLASELFGYDSGTFTGAVKGGRKGKFEEAHQGTLFLDEIGEMPLSFQVHLLRVLQEREVVRLGGSIPIPVDVKIIAATHHNLEQLVDDGVFRADFYYRLQVVSISIPSLSERREDIPLLIDYFLEQFTNRHTKPRLKLDHQVRDFLVNVYEWPGNVRELQNILEHAVLFCQNSIISTEDLPKSIQKTLTYNSPWSRKLVSKTNRKEFSSSDKKTALLSLLQESGGNLSAAARKLGVARTTLYRHLAKYGVRK